MVLDTCVLQLLKSLDLHWVDSETGIYSFKCLMRFFSRAFECPVYVRPRASSSPGDLP